MLLSVNLRKYITFWLRFPCTTTKSLAMLSMTNSKSPPKAVVWSEEGVARKCINSLYESNVSTGPLSDVVLYKDVITSEGFLANSLPTVTFSVSNFIVKAKPPYFWVLSGYTSITQPFSELASTSLALSRYFCMRADDESGNTSSWSFRHDWSISAGRRSNKYANNLLIFIIFKTIND